MILTDYYCKFLQHFLEELEPFPGYTDTDISNHLYNESLRIEPRDCKQPLKFVSN